MDCMRKYDYNCMMRDLHALREKYPALRTGSAGYSVCGRELPWMAAGRGKKTLLMLGTHHGREYVASMFLMRLMEEHLACGEEELFRGAQLVMIPMVNPDGAELSIHGENAADKRIAAMPRRWGDYASWKANANGVDLNRNYPCLWEKKQVIIGEPASEMYNGPRPASEPEVRAVMAFAEELSADLAVTMHTKGEEILYGDANTPHLWAESRAYAEVIAGCSGYAILPPSLDPAVYGAGFENWFRERFSRPCILVEAGRYDGPQPFREERFEREIWQKLGKIGRELLFRLIYT